MTHILLVLETARSIHLIYALDFDDEFPPKTLVFSTITSWVCDDTSLLVLIVDRFVCVSMNP